MFREPFLLTVEGGRGYTETVISFGMELIKFTALLVSSARVIWTRAGLSAQMQYKRATRMDSMEINPIMHARVLQL